MEVNEPSAKSLLIRETQLTELGTLPADWSVSTVGDEFHVQLGKMLDSEKNVGTLKPFLGNRAVQWGRIDVSDIGQIRMSSSDLQRYRLENGDLLVCEGGEVGRSAIWRGQLDECYYQKALHRLRAKRGYSQEFMAAVLEQFAKGGKLQNYVTQTSIAHLPKEKFVGLPIPKPATADEQRRISRAVGDADALIDSLQQLVTKKLRIKQGAMQELLTGKRRLPGFTSEWASCLLGDVVEFSKGSGLSKASLLPDGSVPCIHYGQLFTEFGPVIHSVRSYTNEEHDGATSQVGDVLMPTSDVTPRGLAKASCVMLDGVALGGDILILRPDDALLHGPFLSYFIRSQPERVLELVTGSTVFHLYGRDMAGYRLSLPSIEEQIEIVQVLSDLDMEVAALESRLSKARALKQAMAQALLTGRIRLMESTA
jgi:type I restriction enzyme S subunit